MFDEKEAISPFCNAEAIGRQLRGKGHLRGFQLLRVSGEDEPKSCRCYCGYCRFQSHSRIL